MPFVAIWSVLKLEIAGNPESRRTYADVFKHFTCGLLLIMFATSIFGRLVVGLLAAPEFLPAADLLPFICFGYVFFSASDFFAIPAIVHSRTGYALPAALSGFAVTVLGNLVLVPWIGTYGAALTTIVTFAVHASVNLFVCRRLERIHFPLGAPLTLALVLAGGYMAFRAVLGSTLPAWIAYSGGLLLATASTHVCFGGVIWRRIRPPRETSTAPAPSAMGEPVI